MLPGMRETEATGICIKELIDFVCRQAEDSDSENDIGNGANVLEEEVEEAIDFRQQFPQAFGKALSLPVFKNCRPRITSNLAACSVLPIII